jgi:hypothetical protein
MANNAGGKIRKTGREKEAVRERTRIGKKTGGPQGTRQIG